LHYGLLGLKKFHDAWLKPRSAAGFSVFFVPTVSPSFEHLWKNTSRSGRFSPETVAVRALRLGRKSGRGSQNIK
jgi:hypothetical protein